MAAKRKQLYYIGTSGWTYPSWEGVLYPKNVPKHIWLNYYATKFNTVEINATFYRYFTNKSYSKWYHDVPAGFLIVVKVPQYITHRKHLRDCRVPIKRFVKQAHLLKEKLGLILMQLPSRMPYDLERLETALKSFNSPHQLAVEFRHKKWLTKDAFALLKKYKCIFVDTDSPDAQFINWLPTPTAYLRLHGSKRWYNYNYTHKQLKSLKTRVMALKRKGAKRIFIFFNNDWFGYAVKNACYLKTLLDV